MLGQNSIIIDERPTEEIYGLVEHQEDYSSIEEKLEEESEYFIAPDGTTWISEKSYNEFCECYELDESNQKSLS